MSGWLDTETQALLQPTPPEKLAPPRAAGFTLVLLSIGGGRQDRVAQALRRVIGRSGTDVFRLLAGPLPAAVKTGLSQGDALLGQFELICGDAISVFLADEVAAGAAREYLDGLYARLLQSPEFEQVDVRIESLPAGDRAAAFVEQFLGEQLLGEQFLGEQFLGDASRQTAPLSLLRKKARIMQHWARTIGGRVALVDR